MPRWRMAIIACLLFGCGGPAPAPQTGSPAPEAQVPTAFDAPPRPGTKARCAATGEVFTVEGSTARAERGGKHYVFCCPACKGKFEQRAP